MMTHAMILKVVLFASVGLGIGLVHFLALRLNAFLYLADGTLRRAVALHVLRMLATVAVLTLTAWVGALALLATFGGFVLARPVVLALDRGWR